MPAGPASLSGLVPLIPILIGLAALAFARFLSHRTEQRKTLRDSHLRESRRIRIHHVSSRVTGKSPISRGWVGGSGKKLGR